MDKRLLERMKTDIDGISVSVIKNLENEIKEYLDKCGLFYKVFPRIKSSKSIIEKLEERERRGKKGYKLQDLVGIRIVLYFKADIPLCEKLVSQNYQVVDISKDEEEADKFKPQRINYVCTLPDSIVRNFEPKVWEYPIDQTFEIQIRTVFSEGWHEIEHDFRYKCLKDWDDNQDLSRTMNGIMATLDNCDWTMTSLLNQMAYRHYKAGEWIPMLQNTLRIRITDANDMEDILQYFDQHKGVAKQFFRLEREEFLLWLSEIKMRIPLKLRTVVLLANLFGVKDEYLESITSEILKDAIVR